MKRAILLLLIVAIGVAIWWAERPRPQTLVLTGTVDGNEVVVGSKITGRIVSLAVDDGQWVKAGDLIAVLDQDELRADQGAAGARHRASPRQRAAVGGPDRAAGKYAARQSPPGGGAGRSKPRRNCSRREAQVAQAQAQLRQAQAQVAQTQAAVAKAQDNFNRIRPLVERDINPPQDLVAAQTDLDSAKANEQAAQAGVGGDPGARWRRPKPECEAVRALGGGGAGRAGGRPAGGTPGRRATAADRGDARGRSASRVQCRGGRGALRPDADFRARRAAS